MWAVIVLACWIGTNGGIDTCEMHVMEITETKAECEMLFAVMGSEKPICEPLFIES